MHLSFVDFPLSSRNTSLTTVLYLVHWLPPVLHVIYMQYILHDCTLPVCIIICTQKYNMYRTAPLLRPPHLRPTFMKKRGGRNNEDLRFRLAVKPPPPLPRIRVLCSAVEDENSFDRHAVAVLKDGRVVGHVHVAKYSR